MKFVGLMNSAVFAGEKSKTAAKKKRRKEKTCKKKTQP